MAHEILIPPFKLTNKDLSNFVKYFLKKKCRFLIIPYYILFGLLILLLLIFLSKGSLSSFLSESKTFFALLALLIFLPIAIYYLSMRSLKGSKTLNEKISYRIDLEKIIQRGQSFNVEVKWDVIYNITCDKSYYYIWANKQALYILPQREMRKEDMLLLDSIKRQRFFDKKK